MLDYYELHAAFNEVHIWISNTPRKNIQAKYFHENQSKQYVHNNLSDDDLLKIYLNVQGGVR